MSSIKFSVDHFCNYCMFIQTCIGAFQTHTSISEILARNYRGSNIFHPLPYLILQQPLEICTIIFTV